MSNRCWLHCFRWPSTGVTQAHLWTHVRWTAGPATKGRWFQDDFSMWDISRPNRIGSFGVSLVFNCDTLFQGYPDYLYKLDLEFRISPLNSKNVWSWHWSCVYVVSVRSLRNIFLQDGDSSKVLKDWHIWFWRIAKPRSNFHRLNFPSLAYGIISNLKTTNTTRHNQCPRTFSLLNVWCSDYVRGWRLITVIKRDM